MKSLRKILCLAALSFAAVSCGGNLDLLGLVWTMSPGVGARVKQSLEYNAANPIPVQNVSSNDYRVYVYTDIHVDNSTNNLDEMVSTYCADAQTAPFILCLGDVINATEHFDKYFASIEPITDCGRTVFTSVGNHDIYYNQWDEFISHVGTSTYTFEVQTPSEGKDLFICMDSSSGDIGQRQLKWLRQTLDQARGKYRKTILYTHTHFFKKDNSQSHTSNYNMEDTYELLNIFKTYKVDLVLTGHDHSRDITYYGGVEFRIIDALTDNEPDAYYAIVEISKGGFEFEYVPVGR